MATSMLTYQDALDDEDATEVEKVLDFMRETKHRSIETLVKSFQRKSKIEQIITDGLKALDVEIMILRDGNDVNSTLDLLREQQKSAKDILAYVPLYMNDEEKNTVWLECDFPCPVLFDFSTTKHVHKTNHSAIGNVCKKEFHLKINNSLETYSSDLQTVISICSDREKIRRFVMGAFDLCTAESNVKDIARSVILEPGTHPPQEYKVRNAFSVEEYKKTLVHRILETIGREVKESISGKISKDIEEHLNTRAITDLYIDLFNIPVDIDVSVVRIFLLLFDAVWNQLAMVVAVVVTFFIAQDINSNKWRESIAEVTHKSLIDNRSHILRELSRDCEMICGNLADKLRPEIARGNLLFLQGRPHRVNGHSGCKLTAASYGTDESTMKKVLGLRAENFDHIHLSKEEGIDIFFDKKTVAESTTEMQKVDEYIDKNLKENDQIKFDNWAKLNMIVRKYTPELMKKHSNLVTISTSPVISRRDRIERNPCIVIYCSCKGVIPFGERQFPEKLENMPVDVREGYVYFGSARNFHDPLRQGCSIGASGESKTGSIGVFVKEVDTPDQIGLLTCSHVLLPSHQLIAPRLREKIRKSEVPVDVVQPSYEDCGSNYYCGKLIDAKFGNVVYKGKFTGVDFAYVKMTSRIPHTLKFPSVEWEHTGASREDEEMEMGPPIEDLDENDTEQCYFYGRTSGYKTGKFIFQGAAFLKSTLTASLSPQQRDDQERHLYNLYKINSFENFFQPGDSGASVFIRKGTSDSGASVVLRKRTKEKGHVIGLAVGGLCNGRECFVTPIGAVLDETIPRIEIKCFP